jgi:hypothetical protein
VSTATATSPRFVCAVALLSLFAAAAATGTFWFSDTPQDQAAEILDKRPSQLDAKTGEKTTPYAASRHRFCAPKR